MCGNCYDRRLYIPQRGGVVVIVNLIVSNSCRDNALRSYCTIGYLHPHCLSVCALGMRVCLTMKRGPVPLDKALDPSSNVPSLVYKTDCIEEENSVVCHWFVCVETVGKEGSGTRCPCWRGELTAWNSDVRRSVDLELTGKTTNMSLFTDSLYYNLYDSYWSHVPGPVRLKGPEKKSAVVQSVEHNKPTCYSKFDCCFFVVLDGLFTDERVKEGIL